MTPAYAAPEQIRGDGVGLHTDVYDLGALLYELLTGRAPFDFSERSTAESERIVLEQEPRRPSLAAADRRAAAASTSETLASVRMLDCPVTDARPETRAPARDIPGVQPPTLACARLPERATA